MQISYNTNAPRRPVNLTANSDLVNMVRSENGNLSKLLEQTMITFLTERELYRWKEENKASFDSYNRMIAERGSLSEDLGLLL
ncbi:MAG: type II toxin-antitoxin system CcdA family antitoxin [Desulfuromonadales bacterium]